MRISDWSSDVCSSDLRFMRPAPQHARAAAFEARQHDPKIVAGRQFHETFEAEADFGDIRDLALEPGFARPPDPNADQRRAAIRQRSEEHTSELQSLMRTSYAVFCLKKKNTRTQQATTNQKN